MRPFLRTSHEQRRRSSIAQGPEASGANLTSRRSSLPLSGGYKMLTRQMSELSERKGSIGESPPPSPLLGKGSPRRTQVPTTIAIETRKYPLKRRNTGVEIRKSTLMATLFIIGLLVLLVTVVSYYARVYWKKSSTSIK